MTTETCPGSLIGLMAGDATYSTARDAATGSYPSAYYAYVGQAKPSLYLIYRMYFVADTSVIPLEASVDAVVLHMTGIATYGNPFFITVQNGQPDYPDNPPIFADYDRTLYSGDGGSFDSTTFAIGDNALTFNADGRSWIQKGDGAVTKLCFRSSLDISNTAPAAAEYLVFAKTGAYLYITYSIAGGVDVEIETPLCTISDIMPLTPIVTTGIAGFQSIPRFYVKQLIDDDDLNTYLSTNMTYLKTLEELSLFPTYSDYVAWNSPDGFDLDTYPNQSVFGGVSLDLTGSGTFEVDPSVQYFAAVRQNEFRYTVKNDRQLIIDFTILYIDDPGLGAILTVNLCDSDNVSAGSRQIRVYLQSGAIRPNIGNYSDGDCFIPIRVVFNANNWCKYFINNKLMYTLPVSSFGSQSIPVEGDVLKLLITANGGWNIISETQTNWYDAQYKISRVLITQEY